jgi:hypothetical protein
MDQTAIEALTTPSDTPRRDLSQFITRAMLEALVANQAAISRMNRVIISRGLDPAFGFLHANRPGRLALL